LDSLLGFQNRTDSRSHPPFTPVVSWSCLASIQALLMPPGVRGLPWWLVAGICAVFVVVIGPGDWLVLGRLRRRRWTWVLFPVVAVLTTAVTVGLSRWWMGDHQDVRHLAIVVLDRDGVPRRSDDFELHVAGHDQTIDAACQDQTTSVYEAGDDDGYGWGYGAGRNPTPVCPCTGAVDGASSTRVHLRQWAPVLVHRFGFGGTAPPWSWPRNPLDLEGYKTAITGPAAVVMWDPREHILRPGPEVMLAGGDERLWRDGIPRGIDLESIPDILFTRDFSWNFHTLATGIAPGGGSDLSDLDGALAIADQDPGDDLVMVITATPDGWLLVSRPYPRDPAARAPAVPPPAQDHP
jgi:hypothetical protein